MNNNDNRSTKEKVLTYFSFAVLGVATAFIGLLTYWHFEPSDVYQVKGNTLAVNEGNVRAGGTVILNFSFCKKLSLQGEVEKTFISTNTEIRIPSTLDKLNETCLDNVKIPIPVPGQAPSGEYRVRYVAKYKVNPIKTHVEEYYSEPFMVIGRDQGIQGIQGEQGIEGNQGVPGVSGQN